MHLAPELGVDTNSDVQPGVNTKLVASILVLRYMEANAHLNKERLTSKAAVGTPNSLPDSNRQVHCNRNSDIHCSLICPKVCGKSFRKLSNCIHCYSLHRSYFHSHRSYFHSHQSCFRSHHSYFRSHHNYFRSHHNYFRSHQSCFHSQC